MRIPVTLYAIVARIVHSVVSIRKKHWVFGSDYGNMYREGSKYLLEYMLKHHADYNCTFITRNRYVKIELNKKGIPCEMNFSLKGMIVIARAEAVFTCQFMNDVMFAYKKKGRHFFYILHGMPLKIAARSLPKDFIDKTFKKPQPSIKAFLSRCVNPFVDITDSEFVSVTSEFLKPYEEKDLDYRVPVKVLGMPRNDALFDKVRMAGEKWVDGVDGKFVITYMPTHRKYGQGELSPSPFINRPDFQDWMRDNNVILLIKHHPNMISKLNGVRQTDVIRDITCDRLDPQVCIYHSDVLITDYSSVWMDYLLLNRPILFFIYDNFEQDDVGCHYDIREDPPGHFCVTEEELFRLVKECKYDYDSMKPSERIIHKYHKYVDGNSCERYFKAVVTE